MERKYEARLFENKPNFEVPLMVKARDADLYGTENSEIAYEIINGEYVENFTIDSKTGEIKPKYPMDFEAIPWKNDNNNINIKILYLIVGAKDFGTPSLFTDVSVNIYLHDVNDWSPKFQKKFYSTSIFENLSGGNSVIKVKLFIYFLF